MTRNTYVASSGDSGKQNPIPHRGVGLISHGNVEGCAVGFRGAGGGCDQSGRRRWEGRRRQVWKMGRWSFTLPREGWLMSFFYLPRCWPIPTPGESSRSNPGVKEGYLAEWQKTCLLILVLPLPSWLVVFTAPQS